MEEVKRLFDWGSRFSDEMDRQRRMPFVWGQHDCLIGLVGGTAEALTGENPVAQYAGRYNSELSAWRELRRDGWASVHEFLASMFPVEENLLAARVGDIGMLDEFSLCVVDVSGVIVMTEEGHGRRPRSDMIRSYRVG